MADQKISTMTPAGALTGAELVPAVQSGGNVRTSLADMVAYGNALITLSSLGASANGITLIGHTFAQMRADLDLEAGTDFYSISAADAAIAAAVTAHVGLSDPHTQYLKESDVSANGLTLIGHTFAQMRADLDLEVGVDVQTYDADTAKTDVAQSWTANQTFGGSDANVLTIYRSGAAAKLRFIESTNNNAWGIRNDSSILKLDYNGTDRFEMDSSGNITVANTYADVRLVTGNGSGRLSGRYNTQGTFHDVTYLSTNYKWDTNAIDSASLGTAMLLVKAQNTGTGMIEFWTGAQNTAPTQRAYLDSAVFATNNQLEITGGTLSNTNGLHLYFGSNISRIYSLQNTVAWRDLHVDGATTYINANSLGPVVLAGPSAQVNYGSNGASILYVGGANNQGANIAVRANAGYSRGIIFNTGASSARWYMEATSTAESGGNAGSDFVLSSWTDAGGYLSAPLSITRSTGIATFGAAIIAGGPVRLASYTVAGLPAGSTGDTAYASNGRKNGEGAGAGTGVLVFKDGTAWRACDTGATVAA